MKRKLPLLAFLLLLSSLVYRLQWNYGLYLLPSLAYGDRQFTNFCDELLKEELSQNSLNLHYTLEDPASYGIDSYAISLGSFEENEGGANAMDKLLFRLSTLENNHMNLNHELTMDTLKTYLTQQKSLDEFPYYKEYISPSGGVLFQLPVLLAEYKLESKEDVEEYLCLLALTKDYLQELMEYENAKSDAGLFMSEEICFSVIEECENFLQNQENHYLVTTFDRRIKEIDSLPQEQKNYFSGENQKILKESVYPAYETVINELLLLSDSGTNDWGLCFYPEGREYYAALIAAECGCEDSPEELFSRIEEARTGDLLECALLLAKSPELSQKCSSIELSFEKDMDMLKALEEEMLLHFPSPVNSTYEVKYVEPSMSSVLAPAFYITAPLDSYLDSTIYINHASDYPDLEFFTTLAHEGFPGHLYQTMMTYYYGFEPVRCLMDFPGFVEGWATYVEMMAYYYAGLPEDVASLMQHNQAATLSLYATSDIGIHFFGWKEEEMMKFWGEYGIDNPEGIKEITGIILSNPGNYLSYYIGYLNFLELKESFDQKYGADYSYIDFHEAILKMGPTSFELLEEYLPYYLSS